MSRVVITGIGMVTPFGCGVKYNWDEGVLKSKSAIAKIKGFDTENFTTKIAGEVPFGEGEGQFEPTKYISIKDIKKMDKFIHYAMGAATQAIEDSALSPTEEEKNRIGVMVGSGIGGLGTIYETAKYMTDKNTVKVSPFFIPACLINLASGNISIKYGFKGPNHSVVTACATGTHSIGDAYKIILRDEADIMIAGGAEAAINPIGVAGFSATRALSQRNEEPEKASRPWDKARDGFVMSEGSGVLILEEYEHAKARGAKIYAEVIGYGMSGDAYHITAPEITGSGAKRAMQAAIKSASITPNDVDYINAHGTSTMGDMIEFNAVKEVFSDALSNLSMSSTKSSTGHLLGAAGAIEAIFSVLSIRDSIIPPTINLDDPEEGTEVIDLVPHKVKEKNVNIAISNSFGFGGTNACLIFKKLV